MDFKDARRSSTPTCKKKNRPTQRLYVPPAQRNKRQGSKTNKETQGVVSEKEVEIESRVITNPLPNDRENEKGSVSVSEILPNIDGISEALSSQTEVKESMDTLESQMNSLQMNEVLIKEGLKISGIDAEKSLVIMLDNIKTPQKTDIDGEKEEMQRAIVNINRKTRPLIKHVKIVESDILHIDVIDKKTVSNLKKPKHEVSNWEDLFNEDDNANEDHINQVIEEPQESIQHDSEEDDTPTSRKNKLTEDLDHVIELYDFPATFKSHDIMQLYHDVQKDATMYIRWCDDTHALLVFSSPMLAQRALKLHNNVIKSRAMIHASLIAVQTATKSDLKPAMKRPQTTMQTARRMINTHLGTRTKISKEEQEKEREMLRRAKELKKSQRQNEKDAWEGYSRPSTA